MVISGTCFTVYLYQCTSQIALKTESARQEVLAEDKHVEAMQDLRRVLVDKEAEAARLLQTSKQQKQQIVDLEGKTVSTQRQYDESSVKLSKCTARAAEIGS